MKRCGKCGFVDVVSEFDECPVCQVSLLESDVCHSYIDGRCQFKETECPYEGNKEGCDLWAQ